MGFRAVHLGISDDPLARVAGFRADGYAAPTYVAVPSEEDRADCDRLIEPIEQLPWLPAGCGPWSRALRNLLAGGMIPASLAAQVGVLLRPIEASRCAHLPGAVARRAAAGRFLPVLPRYSIGERGAALVEDIYRLDGPGDWKFVARVLNTVLAIPDPPIPFSEDIGSCWEALRRDRAPHRYAAPGHDGDGR